MPVHSHAILLDSPCKTPQDRKKSGAVAVRCLDQTLNIVGGAEGMTLGQVRAVLFLEDLGEEGTSEATEEEEPVVQEAKKAVGRATSKQATIPTISTAAHKTRRTGIRQPGPWY